jgi:hypothetical protein
LSGPFAPEVIEVALGIDAGQGSGKLLERIVFANEGDLTWSAHVCAKAVSNLEACPSEGIHWEGDLVLDAYPRPAASAIMLYLSNHR